MALFLIGTIFLSSPVVDSTQTNVFGVIPAGKRMSLLVKTASKFILKLGNEYIYIL